MDRRLSVLKFTNIDNLLASRLKMFINFKKTTILITVKEILRP